MDLVSDEGVNRLVLKWFKLWDPTVFGRPRKEKTNAIPPPEGFRLTLSQQEEFLEADESGRAPKLKILMLAGPPGLGKTTLAHIIASHAGYSAVELNASDDRNEAAFVAALSSVSESQGDVRAGKPLCLILDEVDGSGAPAIAALLRYVSGTRKSKKKGATTGPQRPVVCICNDSWAPALRKLRPVCLIVNVPIPIPACLVTRLVTVAKGEKVAVDRRVLQILCEKAGFDMRSCLNTLQLLSRTPPLTAEVVRNTSVGVKDTDKGMYHVWQTVFQLPRAQTRRFSRVGGRVEQSENPLAGNVRFRNIVETSQATGDYERQIDGFYENYLTISSRASQFGIAYAADWLVAADHFRHSIQASQNWLFLAYMPYVATVFHFICASSAPGKISYPTNTLRTELAKHESTLSSFLSHITPHVSSFYPRLATLLDLSPLITEILQPSIRPVSTQLYSAKEKLAIKQLVSIMTPLGLSFDEGELQPPLDILSAVSGPPRWRLSGAARQAVTREIQLENVRHHTPLGILDIAPIVVPKDSVIGKLPYSFKRAAPENGEPVEVVPSVLNANLWFRYKEGYNNAVRRPVKVAKFLN